jgi:hypothetical protein
VQPPLPLLGCVPLLCDCQGDQLQLLLLGCVLPVGAKTTFHDCHHWAACNRCVVTKATGHNCSTGVIATAGRLPRRIATGATAGLLTTALQLPGDLPRTFPLMGCVRLLHGCQGDQQQLLLLGYVQWLCGHQGEEPQLLLLGCVQLLCGCQGEGA